MASVITLFLWGLQLAFLKFFFLEGYARWNTKVPRASLYSVAYR